MAWIVGIHKKGEAPYWFAMDGGTPNPENRCESLAMRFDRKEDALSFIRFVDGSGTLSLLKYWIFKEIFTPNVMSDTIHECAVCKRKFIARNSGGFVGFRTDADEFGNLHISGNLCNDCHGHH